MIEAQDLVLEYVSGKRQIRALDGVSLRIAAGDRLGIVGESGSGKSTFGAALGRLLPPSAHQTGALRVDGVDVFEADRDRIRELRQNTMAFIPQDPVSSLDPTKRIGKQLALATGVRDRTAQTEMLDRVKIRQPAEVLRRYPFEISGGMAQRVVIAIAMARRPRILVADEPTASLDSLVRDEVLALMFATADELSATLVWLSHDLAAVRRWCGRVAVMHRGRVVEEGPAADVLDDPQHEYTQELVASDPRNRRATAGGPEPEHARKEPVR
ncbi:ABC transporter ATP-binding protein [Cryptosporangium aurantiacum]|uniref:ABC-type dipeptide/oligopeptide/nickel transport system, ATPase component n=1 Tax=Cryptosporangium aurantiacum TaxID=134849 RepID=A0A1M7HAP3_9ACTN|nr:ABC transporter ATP-binding protein [Cryptosporangium aurantiacum]SHM25520.1 ABC-type dipeptide/oligopeptide/nickel transport system, ATPase component [Cryptosporangium aurantiacum]